jgi:hypothetical protein
VSDAASDIAPRSARYRLWWGIGSLLAAAGLFALYLRQALTTPGDSDGAANALQAWDMLHGNLLLHGWWLGDATYYTTELPEYVLVEAVRGLNPDVVRICSALTYTLLVLLAALLARSRTRGREGVVRALLAGGVMLAPGIFLGTGVLLGVPDHVGTGVPVLLILLLLDRAEEWKRRWPVPVAIGLMLIWVQIADPLATYAVAVPMVLVCAGRAGVALIRGRRGSDDLALANKRGDRLRAGSYDLALTAAAAVSVPVAHALLARIYSAGGFYAYPIGIGGPLLGRLAAVPTHALVTGESVLVLFGANFFGQPSRIGAALALLHLAGVAAAALGLLAGVGVLFTRLDRVGQILVTGTIVILAAGVFSARLTNLTFAHEIAIVLPFGAVLAGRLLAAPLTRTGLQPVLAAVLAAYLGALCYAAAGAPVPAKNQAAADWLVAHHLTYGVAGYWQAASITLDTGGRVTVAPLYPGTTHAYYWESDGAWYDPRLHYADFVVTVGSSDAMWRGFFGPAARTYHYQQYTIMVWHKNLLTLLAPGRA